MNDTLTEWIDMDDVTAFVNIHGIEPNENVWLLAFAQAPRDAVLIPAADTVAFALLSRWGMMLDQPVDVVAQHLHRDIPNVEGPPWRTNPDLSNISIPAALHKHLTTVAKQVPLRTFIRQTVDAFVRQYGLDPTLAQWNAILTHKRITSAGRDRVLIATTESRHAVLQAWAARNYTRMTHVFQAILWTMLEPEGLGDSAVQPPVIHPQRQSFTVRVEASIYEELRHLRHELNTIMASLVATLFAYVFDQDLLALKQVVEESRNFTPSTAHRSTIQIPHAYDKQLEWLQAKTQLPKNAVIQALLLTGLSHQDEWKQLVPVRSRRVLIDLPPDLHDTIQQQAQAQDDASIGTYIRRILEKNGS